MRIAAADIHFGPESAGTYRRHLEGIKDRADLLLIAGDLSRVGDPAEAAILANELCDTPVPIVVVLGNHDFHGERQDHVVDILQSAGIRVLEGDPFVLEKHGRRLAVAGVKGFGGGFTGACGSDFGEPEMKAFIRHTRQRAERLSEALALTDADIRVALMHYAPVPETLQGERREIYPFLGLLPARRSGGQGGRGSRDSRPCARWKRARGDSRRSAGTQCGAAGDWPSV